MIPLTLVCAALLPYTGVFFGMLFLASGSWVLAVRARRSYLKFGKPGALGIETAAALVVIPLSGLVGNVGTSLAFYEMSRPGAHGWTDGWYPLAMSIFVALAIIFIFVRMMARHQSGADPLPFEANVDPKLGIRELRRLRTRPYGGLLHGQVRFAAERVNETLRMGSYASQPRLREAIGSIVRGKYDRIQLLVLAGGAMLWTVGLGGRWWATLIVCFALIGVVVLGAGVGGLVWYYTHLQWARRESTLQDELCVHVPAHDEGVLGEKVLQTVNALADEIRALRILLEKHRGARCAREWLLAMLRKAQGDRSRGANDHG